MCALSLSCQASEANADPKALVETYNRDIKPLVGEFCYKCHGNGKKKGKVTLDGELSPDPSKWNVGVWLSAIDQTADATMPPEESKQPTKEQRDKIAHWFAQAVAVSDTLRPKDPGFVALHRLNRTEYNNTVRDLTGIDFYPAEDFPSDDSGYGFDNIADVLSLSPLLTEKYLEAADTIVERIVKEASGEPVNHPLPFVAAKVNGGISKNSSQLGFYSTADATFACKLVPGAQYVVRIKAFQDEAGDEPARMLVSVHGAPVSLIEVEALNDAPGSYSCRFKATQESELLRIDFVNDWYDEKVVEANKRDRNLRVDSVDLFGPLKVAPSTLPSGVFIARPSRTVPESACAEQIIRRFATRAFRRPLKEAEFAGLLKLYSNARKDVPFETAISVPLKAILVSPHFLFRVETRPAEAQAAGWMLNDYEFATRLSYFLWSTMPDEELFAAAQHGFKSPATREEEIKRMLKDPRSSQLVENFAGQWLELRNLEDIYKDGKLYPAYNNNLKEAMRDEALLFFTSIMREDRNIMTLVDADYTFVNERLAEVYGLKGIKGDDLRRVTLDPKMPRGGVITMGSTLSLTANPARTSPVKRGKWVLDQILGVPPPPPPPEVPALPENKKEVKAATVRERLEKHRADPACAACHNRMDGIGFALENFDPIGRWRDADGKSPIDASGTLPGAAPFNGAKELKALILKKRDMVVRNFVQKLLTYALGRGIKQYDRPAVNEIMRNSEQNNFRFSSVIAGIVNSDAFLKRRDKRGDE